MTSIESSIRPALNVICKWHQGGKEISLFKGRGEANYITEIRGNSSVFPLDIDRLNAIELTTYMQIEGITDVSEGREKFYEEYIARFIECNIPSVGSGGDFSWFAVKTVHLWKLDTERETKKVALLQRQDFSLLWRISIGKIHSIVEKSFKVLCHFPRANPKYLSDSTLPFFLPWCIANTNFYKKEFLKDHKLTGIVENRRTSHEYFELFFSQTSPILKSKFNPSTNITKYEWGITLISYSPGVDSTCDQGHAAIIIESVKNGNYHAEHAHVTKWEENQVENAGKVCLKREAYCYDKNSRRRVFLKDVENARECYKNLTYSDTLIRRGKSVEHMIAEINRQITLQTLSAPKVCLNKLGDNIDSLKSLVKGMLFTSTSLKNYELSNSLEKDFTLGQHGLKWQNCVTWSKDMLLEAGMTVIKSPIVDCFVNLPRNPILHGRFTVEDEDHPCKPLNVHKRILLSQRANAAIILKWIFKGNLLMRQNYFIHQGRVRDEHKTRALIHQIWCNYSRSIKYETRRAMAFNNQNELTFNRDQCRYLIYPLMERLIYEEVISDKVLQMLSDNNVYLEIKQRGDWEDKEDYYFFPKTYQKTVTKILTNCLIYEVCEKLLWATNFSSNKWTFF
ncbi:MAG: hypothetical protein K1060chlam2_00541 [Chlamydiae bacterium]|nr:hypothetical protein [Chlamydiota bacterium]